MPPPRMATVSGSFCDVLVAVMDVMRRTTMEVGCFSWNENTWRVERRMTRDVNITFISMDVLIQLRLRSSEVLGCPRSRVSSRSLSKKEKRD